MEGKITHSASGLCCGDKDPHSSKWKSMKLILALFENKEEAVMLLTSLETQSCVIPRKNLVNDLDCDCRNLSSSRRLLSKSVGIFISFYRHCRFSLVVVTYFWGMIHPIRLPI